MPRKKKTNKDFIKELKKVHNDVYDYSKVKYFGALDKIKVVCKKHGEFEISAHNHLNGQGCKLCGNTKNSDKNKSNKNEFIEKAEKIHGNKYDYNKTVYNNSRTKVTITCSIHGDFEQRPADHIQGRGCSKCKSIIPDEFKTIIKRGRVYIRRAYVKQGYSTDSIVYQLLGCDWNTFKQHLENNLYGFKVGDKDLDLDHILPISKVRNKEQVLNRFNYMNYQLLPSDYNKYIKRDNDFDEKHFNNWFSTLIKNNF